MSRSFLSNFFFSLSFRINTHIRTVFGAIAAFCFFSAPFQNSVVCHSYSIILLFVILGQRKTRSGRKVTKPPTTPRTTRRSTRKKSEHDLNDQEQVSDLFDSNKKFHTKKVFVMINNASPGRLRRCSDLLLNSSVTLC